MRILLVEDNSDHRELMRLALTGHDSTWQVETVASGEEALRLLLGGEVFDLVFLDYSLPGWDGLEVLEEIRRGEAPPPVVMVTGRGDERVAVKAMKCGAYDYVVKGKGYLQRLPVVARHAMDAQQLVVERKRAEEALQKSEAFFKAVTENSLDSILILDKKGTIIYASPSIERFSGYKPEELIGKSGFDFILPADLPRAISDFGKAVLIKKDVIIPNAFRCRHKNGSERVLEGTGNNLLDYPAVTGFVVNVRDITDRKLAEEKIHASLQEKEMLLREVHHRVKNNLQVISGLLDLKAASSGNPELIEMFHESQSRIRSMALIHEKLYDSKDFARIDLAGYVRGLSQELFQSYKINPGEIDLIIQTGDDVYVDINKAIPCGLILNELISNALKHAFAGDGASTITISIRKSDDNEVEIAVRDNGLGLPDDVDIRQPRSVGLHLVNGLVKNQLDGQIEVRRDNGTEFRILFPL